MRRPEPFQSLSIVASDCGNWQLRAIKQDLNLLQFAAIHMAERGARSAKKRTV
jgi:hypothetical protein